MQQIFAFGFEARGAVGHDAFALGGADFAAKVRLAGFAEFAFAAFGRAGAGGFVSIAFKNDVELEGSRSGILERDDSIAWFYGCHALAD